MGGAVFPACCSTWGQTMMEVMKIMETSFKRSMQCHTQYPQPHSRPPPTHASAGDSWTLTGKSGSVSCGGTAPFSWVLVCTSFCFALHKSVSPVLCKSGSSMVGLTGTSSKRAYAIPRSTAPRAPASAAVCWWPVPPQETLKHSSGSVSVSWCSPGLLEPSIISGGYGVWF